MTTHVPAALLAALIAQACSGVGWPALRNGTYGIMYRTAAATTGTVPVPATPPGLCTLSDTFPTRRPTHRPTQTRRGAGARSGSLCPSSSFLLGRLSPHAPQWPPRLGCVCVQIDETATRRCASTAQRQPASEDASGSGLAAGSEPSRTPPDVASSGSILVRQRPESGAPGRP